MGSAFDTLQRSSVDDQTSTTLLAEDMESDTSTLENGDEINLDQLLP